MNGLSHRFSGVYSYMYVRRLVSDLL